MSMRVLVLWVILAAGTQSACGQLDLLAPVDSAAAKANEKVEQILDLERDMVFNNATLEEIANYFKAFGVPVHIGWPEFDVVGIDRAVKFELRRDSIALRDGLTLLLDKYELAWSVDGGKLCITTQEEADANLVTKIYDVRNLVEAKRGVQWHAGPSEELFASTVYYYDFDPIVGLIMTTVAPDTWDDVGGPGSVFGYPSRHVRGIVVSQTYKVHKQVEQMLANMTRFSGSDPLPEIPPDDFSNALPRTAASPSRSMNRRPSSIRSSRLRTSGQ